MFTQLAQADGEAAGRHQGVGVVLAQHPAPAGQGVLVQRAGPHMLTQQVQVGGEVVGRAQGVGVVVAQHPAAAGQGVLIQFAGPLVLTQMTQVEGEIIGRKQGVRVLLAEHVAAQLVCPFEQRPSGSRLTPGVQVTSGAVEQPRNVSVVRVGAAGGLSDGQYVRQQLPPGRPGRQVVPRVSRDSVPQQLAGDSNHVVFVEGADRAVAEDGLYEAVDLQAVWAHSG